MSDVKRTIEAVWKDESTRLIAAIARVTRDIGVAEELAHDALITALELPCLSEQEKMRFAKYL